MAAIRIWRTDSQVQIEVPDEGKGMPSDKKSAFALPGKEGVDIRGMCERVRQLNGSLEIKSSENPRGTVVLARFPTQHATTSMTA